MYALNEQKKYYYVAVRQDMPIEHQFCQAIHAATDAGKYFGVPEDCNLVLLGVPDKEHLEQLSQTLRKDKVPYTKQIEPDMAPQESFTALATGVLLPSECRLFRKLRLWKAPKNEKPCCTSSGLTTLSG